MTKTFQVVNERTSKAQWVVIRQIAGLDRIYKIGDKTPGCGRVIGIKVEVASR